MKYDSIIETIGNTPIVKINSLFPKAIERNIEIWAKIERFNPGGSIKDRIALAMLEDAQKNGQLKEGSIIVEPTSGNTGVGLAMVAAAKGYQLIITMPESMSIERRKIMSAYGAQIILTPKEKGMNGAIAQAKEIADQNPNAWMPMQFENESNVSVHEKTTAQEIIADFPEGLDYLIAGVGTGGHLSGCAKVLKEKMPQLQVYAVEPEDSPVISGGNPGPHPIQGIGAGFIPKILATDFIDDVAKVNKDRAFHFAINAAKKEALLIGISSGASLAAVELQLPKIKDNSKVLLFCYDTGERYLSVDGLF